VFNFHDVRRHFISAAVLVAAAAAGGCSQPAPSSATPASSPEQEAETTYANPGEAALLAVAHKKFPPDAVFTDEIISDASGEKRVCGQVSIDRRSAKYVFSLSQGLQANPDADAWRGSCLNGWKPGSGF
jgi:hypothetical protein